MAKTAYRTWVTDERVTAVQMNEQIRDNGNEIWKGTTEGDIDFYTSSTTKSRLGIGTAGQVLKVNADATAPEWNTATVAGSYFLGTTVSSTSTGYIPLNQWVATLDPLGWLDVDKRYFSLSAGVYMIAGKLSIGSYPTSFVSLKVHLTRDSVTTDIAYTNSYNYGNSSINIEVTIPSRVYTFLAGDKISVSFSNSNINTQSCNGTTTPDYTSILSIIKLS